MSTEVIIALFTSAGALLAGAGGIISAVLLNRKTTALLEYRLGEVERKLDSHNGYAQRFAETTADIAEMKTDIAVIKTKLEYISER